MMTDLRFAFRQLFKSPGFTLLALITLALGIGLNTAIFSLINDLFLRGLPFANRDRVVQMCSAAASRSTARHTRSSAYCRTCRSPGADRTPKSGRQSRFSFPVFRLNA